MTPHVLQALEAERAHTLKSVLVALAGLGDFARTESERLRKNATSETLDLHALFSQVDGLRGAVVKISVLNHVLKMIDARQLDTLPDDGRK